MFSRDRILLEEFPERERGFDEQVDSAPSDWLRCQGQ